MSFVQQKATQNLTFTLQPTTKSWLRKVKIRSSMGLWAPTLLMCFHSSISSMYVPMLLFGFNCAGTLIFSSITLISGNLWPQSCKLAGKWSTNGRNKLKEIKQDVVAATINWCKPFLQIRLKSSGKGGAIVPKSLSSYVLFIWSAFIDRFASKNDWILRDSQKVHTIISFQFARYLYYFVMLIIFPLYLKGQQALTCRNQKNS